MADETQLTPEEIQQYREQLKEIPQAIAQLDIIEKCGGNLEQATRVLARRVGAEEVRKGMNWETALKKARKVVCNDDFKDGLAPDVISGVFLALVAAGDPFLLAVAAPCAGYIVKVSLSKFCKQK